MRLFSGELPDTRDGRTREQESEAFCLIRIRCGEFRPGKSIPEKRTESAGINENGLHPGVDSINPTRALDEK